MDDAKVITYFPVGNMTVYRAGHAPSHCRPLGNCDKHCLVNDSWTLTDKSSDKHSLVNDKWTLTDKSSDKHSLVNDN